MAINISACQVRASGFDVEGSIDDGGRKTVTQTAKVNYLALATPTAGEDPSDISPAAIACYSGLPTVNVSTYYDSANVVVLPSALCMSKRVTRNDDNAWLFEVECEFKTQDLEEEECVIAPPANVTDITPQVRSKINSYERVLYADKDGVQCWQLPGTKTPFQAPITETIPLFQLEIVQYETGITFEQQIERSFKLNSATYRGKAAGLWMIGEVSAVETEVVLAGGPATGAKVTYPITLSERFYFPPGVTATPANAIVYGHDKVQPLVDTMKISTDSPQGPTQPRLVPMSDENTGNVYSGYITSSGFEREVVNPDDDRPDYLRFRTQDPIDFSTFLQA